MANAFLLKPLVPVSVSAFATLQAGALGNALLDYAGLIARVAMDFGSTAAPFVLDFGADMQIDTIMVFGVALIPGGGTFAIRYGTAAQGSAATLGPNTSAYAGATAMTSGLGVTMLYLSSPITARYLRLDYGGAGTGQSVQVSRFVIGKRIQLARNFSTSDAHGVKDLGSLEFSPRGVMQRRRGAKLRTIGLTFSNVQKDELEATMKPLIEQIGNTELIALVTDPAADTQLQNRCYFGPLVGDLSAVRRNVRVYETKLNVVSIF